MYHILDRLELINKDEILRKYYQNGNNFITLKGPSIAENNESCFIEDDGKFWTSGLELYN